MIDALVDHVEAVIVSTLSQLPETVRNDVYALSLYTCIEDVEVPELIFSFNTNEQVHRAMQGETNTYGNPSDEAEARWNYAFWMQTPCINFLRYQDRTGRALWESHLASIGLVYSEDDDFDVDAFEQAILSILEDIAARVVARLHNRDILARYFGRDLPVLVHQLEYDDHTAELAR